MAPKYSTLFSCRGMTLFEFTKWKWCPNLEKNLNASTFDFKDTGTPEFWTCSFWSIYRNTLLYLISVLSNFSKLLCILGLPGPKLFDFMSDVPQIPFIKHFCWWVTDGTFWCFLLKIDKKLHRYDKVAGYGVFEVLCRYSLQAISPVQTHHKFLSSICLRV